jgi:hypothetical protein
MIRFTLQKGQNIEQAWRDWMRGLELTVETTSGTVTVVHGSEDGTFGGKAVPSADFVACCYPKQQQAQNPHLQVVGNWAETTKVLLNDEEMVILPASDMHRKDNREQRLPKGGWFYM